MIQKDREARAQRELELHREQMIHMWGTNYMQHPNYVLAVEQIAHRARMPFYVLADYGQL